MSSSKYVSHPSFTEEQLDFICGLVQTYIEIRQDNEEEGDDEHWQGYNMALEIEKQIIDHMKINQRAASRDE